MVYLKYGELYLNKIVIKKTKQTIPSFLYPSISKTCLIWIIWQFVKKIFPGLSPGDSDTAV